MNYILYLLDGLSPLSVKNSKNIQFKGKKIHENYISKLQNPTEGMNLIAVSSSLIEEKKKIEDSNYLSIIGSCLNKKNDNCMITSLGQKINLSSSGWDSFSEDN